MFKKFLTGLGAITFVLIIFSGLRYGVSVISGSMIDKEAAAYANEAVKAIATRWDAQQLVNRAHPELLAQTDSQKFTLLFDKLREMGKLKKLEACAGQANIGYSSFFNYFIGNSANTTAKYACQAAFDHAPATISMLVHKDDKAGWQIVSINVDSPFFRPPAAKTDAGKPEDK